ncbi:hypothetical protein LCGC14_0900510 [marine sediment metagenome]|uniref:Uncharacterized protein n=1 Tax=marine sediment metagenome TaxID=412755 RepID=A0A0F9P1I5_9ZZZZ
MVKYMIIKKNCVTCSNFNFLTRKCHSSSFPKVNLNVREGWRSLANYYCKEYEQIHIMLYDGIIGIENSRLFIFDKLFGGIN